MFDTEWTNIKAGQAWAVAHTRQKTQTPRNCVCIILMQAVYVLESASASTRTNSLAGSGTECRTPIEKREAEGAISATSASPTRPRRDAQGDCFYEQRLAIAREIDSASNSERGKRDRRTDAAKAVPRQPRHAYADLGETRKAIEFYEQALIINREIGDRRGEGNASATSASPTPTSARRARRLSSTSRP